MYKANTQQLVHESQSLLYFQRESIHVARDASLVCVYQRCLEEKNTSTQFPLQSPHQVLLQLAELEVVFVVHVALGGAQVGVNGAVPLEARLPPGHQRADGPQAQVVVGKQVLVEKEED